MYKMLAIFLLSPLSLMAQEIEKTIEKAVETENYDYSIGLAIFCTTLGAAVSWGFNKYQKTKAKNNQSAQPVVKAAATATSTNTENHYHADSIVTEKDYVSPRVSMKLLNNSIHPVLIVNKRNEVVWCNNTTKNLLEIGRGSNFNYTEALDYNKKTKSYHYHVYPSQNYMVQKSQTFVNNEKCHLFYFVPFELCVGERAYSLTEESFTIEGLLESTLDKYNYLYKLSGVPISITSNILEENITGDVQGVFDDLVFLNYMISKDIKNSKVEINLDTKDTFNIIEFQIRGLNFQMIESMPEVYTEDRGFINIIDFLKEVEVKLSGFGARLFIYDTHTKDVSRLTISVNFHTKKEAAIIKKDDVSLVSVIK